MLLGLIVRKASGQFYGDVLRDRVFAPLGMKTARVIDEAAIVRHRAAGYVMEDGELRNQAWVAPTLNTTADGALYLSLRDMVAWDAGLRARQLLSAEGWTACSCSHSRCCRAVRSATTRCICTTQRIGMS